MVVYGSTIITGSFNFTKAAEEKNAENLLVIRDIDLAASRMVGGAYSSPQAAATSSLPLLIPVVKPGSEGVRWR